MVSIRVASRLDPDVETTTLDNGLAVTTVALPHLHTAVCALFIKVGARFELPEDNGLSHFTEHMLFRGTDRYPTSLALNTAVERLGSTLHAETGRDYTLFQLALEPELVGSAIHLLGQRIIGPRANVERFSIDDVRRHFATFYGARNANLCVAGPIEHGAIVEAAVRALGVLPT